MTTSIKIERYKNPEQTAGWAGYVEPGGRDWILYFAEDGRTKFYPERDPYTGAVREPDAPVTLFTAYRHEDPTGVSGAGVVGYGWRRQDGRAVFRWLGDYPTETVHERGMESVYAIHSHKGLTSFHEAPASGGDICLPLVALGLSSGSDDRDGVWLSRTQDAPQGMVFGRFTPESIWRERTSPDPVLLTGDLIEGVVIDGEQHLFRPRGWAGSEAGTLGSRGVIELFAQGPSHLLVTRVLDSQGGAPALVRVPLK